MPNENENVIENNEETTNDIEVKDYKYIYGVSFKNVLLTYYFGSDTNKYEKDDKVVVETARGLELGYIVNEYKENGDIKLETSLKPIVRLATQEDLTNYEKNNENAKKANEIFIQGVMDQKLDMHLISSEYTLDATKIIFTYIADERVDFRELLKILAAKLHCRIELHQIGARDRAKAIGGIGPCGLPLCCSTFLSDFEGISINMAKNQLLALNISKLSGQCGKLICCLKYEDSLYSDLKVGLPKLGQKCKYKDEEFKITSMNVLSKTMKLENSDNSLFVTFDEYFKEAKNDTPTKLSKQ